MQKKSLKLGVIFNILRSIMAIIFPIISFPYASRILLPSGLGKINFANSIIEWFLMLAELGILTYAAREAAKLRENQEELNKFSREILALNLISTVVSYITLTIAIFFVPKFFEYRLLLIICSTTVLFSTLGLNWLYTALEEYGYIAVRQTVFQVISLILLFTFVKKESDYLIYAGIGVFANVGSNIFNLIHSRKFINLFAKTKLEIKKHIRPVFIFFGSAIAGKINNTVDTLMLGFLMTPADVGYYAAALKINKLVRDIITSVMGTFMPRMSYYAEQEDQEEYIDLIEKTGALALFFSIPAAAGLFFLARPIINVFCGEQYLPALNSMRLISLTIIITSINSFLNSTIIIPLRKEKFLFYGQIICAFFNCILNFLLIPRMGVFGAALATTIVELIFPLVKVLPSWQILHKIKLFLPCIQSVIATIIMYLALYAVTKRIENDILAIISSIALGGTVYAGCQLCMKNKTAMFIVRKFSNKHA